MLEKIVPCEKVCEEPQELPIDSCRFCRSKSKPSSFSCLEINSKIKSCKCRQPAHENCLKDEIKKQNEMNPSRVRLSFELKQFNEYLCTECSSLIFFRPNFSRSLSGGFLCQSTCLGLEIFLFSLIFLGLGIALTLFVRELIERENWILIFLIVVMFAVITFGFYKLITNCLSLSCFYRPEVKLSFQPNLDYIPQVAGINQDLPIFPSPEIRRPKRKVLIEVVEDSNGNSYERIVLLH